MATITGTFNSLVGGTLSGTIGTPGPQGNPGMTGATGPAGPAGAPGVGVPAGGLEGQILLKASDVSYDTVWADNSAVTLTATVRNETGATLSKGTVVYINGGSGNKPLVVKASASSESSSSKTFAILAEDIPTNQNGTAVTMGLLKGIDTSAFTAGANLWLSTTAGQITQTMPTTPNHAVFLGNAVRIHANQGEIEVRIQNGYELGELHDVLLTSPSNGQVLKYDSATGLWVNGTDVGGVAWGGITGDLSNQGDLVTALGLKYDASNPAGYITASALSPYLLSSTAASTYQTLSGMSSYLTTSAASATYFTIASAAGKANLSGATFTGKVNLPSSISASAYLNLAPGFNPSSPVNGDIWVTGAGFYARINGVSQLMASTTYVQSQGYTTTTYVNQSVAASLLKPQATFSGSFEVPSTYNNYMLTLDSSDGTNKSVTFGGLTVGSNVTFVQGGTDQIVFPSANAYQNKLASAGPSAVVTAHSTSGGWYLEGDLTYIPAGYVLSSTCVYYEGNDALGVFWADYYYSEAIVADGSGGTYSTSTPNANGCWYPSGYCIQKSANYNEMTNTWEVYDSTTSLVASGTYAYEYQYDAEFADGYGTTYWTYGITWNAYYGYLYASGDYYDSGYGMTYYYEVYSDGGSGYYVNQYS